VTLAPLLLLVLAPLRTDAEARSEPQGLIVESVAKPPTGEAPAVQPGDVLVSWMRAASPPANPQEAHGLLSGPFDLAHVETEQSPRGLVTLSLVRHGEALSLALPRTEWRIDVRPPMAPAAAALYAEARRLLDAKEEEKALAKLREAVGLARPHDRPVACWLAWRVGALQAAAERWDEAVAAYRDALLLADEPLVRATLADSVGEALWHKQDLSAAEAAFREALGQRQAVANDSLGTAATLYWLARVAWYRNEVRMAEDLFRKSLALRETWGPESLVLAQTQVQLGIVLDLRDSRGENEELCRRSLVIRERLAPGSLAVAQSQSCLGGAAWRSGDLSAARRWQEGALRIRERLAPDSNDVSWSLNGLALLALDQGDYASADRLLRRAVVHQETLDPRFTGIQSFLNNLGVVAWNRADLDSAEAFYRRSLEKCVQSIRCAEPLLNLAEVADARGDTSKAEAFAEEAVALLQRLPSDGFAAAVGLAAQGRLAAKRHDWAHAEDLLKRALAIQEQRTRRGLPNAETLLALGEVAEGRGDEQGAASLFARAVDIRERLAPRSAALAESLHRLGRARRVRGEIEEASALFARAIEVVEAERGRWGGSDTARARFGSRLYRLYQDQTELLVGRRRIADAFHVLEQSRARSLLTLMAERDLVLAAEIPPQLESQRRRIDAAYERVRSQLATLSAENDAADIDRLTLGPNGLNELRDQQNEIAEKIRQSSPRLSELRYPQPLDATGVRARLDPGSVLLAYSVGKDQTLLFVLKAQAPPEAVTIPIGEEALRTRITVWRRLLERTAPPAEFFQEGQALYELLIRPVERHLVSARRLLISPDGPLHTLPFAALRRNDGYLIEWKPTHFAQSGTLYARLLEGRNSAARSTTLVAFGAPQATTGGLDPLPATRREIDAIARSFPGAMTYLGAEATEERAKAIGKNARYVHFACHSLIDGRFPLDSALALAPSARSAEEHDSDGDNGLLHAWEIFERMRLDADLVTLSSCDSATGADRGGEGLIGLTRAFQYAGARSVLASLWSVGDESTLELMTRFYGLLRQGLSKDAALRQAQLAAIRSRRHPVRWAAFQLYGDWR
jgi:CHAT domain-containing protein